MKFRSGYIIAALVASALTMPLSSEAAGPQFRAKFSYDAIASCENPHIRNFPVHGEGTGVLSADRSATLAFLNISVMAVASLAGLVSAATFW
jgi:hypothetical protein